MLQKSTEQTLRELELLLICDQGGFLP